MKLLRYSNNKGLYILIVAIILLVWAGAVFWVEKDYQNKYEGYVAYRDESFDNTIAGVVRAYEGFSNFIFSSAVDNDSIKAYLYEANKGDEAAKAAMRKELARELYQTHSLIREHNFRQFHFQLVNGESFYRFHNPDKFGDNLLDVRESIRIANVEKRYIAGFEEGRTFSGYRFVYPISYEGEHVGSIEISVSPQGIMEELYALDSNRDIGFILSKKIMQNTVFDDQQARYNTSFISEDYVYDTEILTVNEANRDSPKLYKNEAFLNQLKPLITEDLQKGLPISVIMEFEKKIYLIQYRSIEDISRQKVGYFFSFKEDDQIQSFITAKKLVSLLSTVIMLFLILLVAYMHNRQKEIQKVAMTDNLTSLYNRHSFYPLANRELARSVRNEEPLSIAMLDIDYFKRVNDTYGHTVGDLVLKRVAKLIKASIRETDILARYGGEEFVVLMPSTHLDGAYIVAERIRTSIENYSFENLDQITISIGLSEKTDKEKIDELIDKADKALYEAKEAGRNKTIRYREAGGEDIVLIQEKI